MRVPNRFVLLPAVVLTTLAISIAQQGPRKDSGETVARPRKKDSPAGESEQPKIPSRLGKKDKAELPEGLPTFKSDVTTINVDVAVLDNKGRFIPGIPKGNFRILED